AGFADFLRQPCDEVHLGVVVDALVELLARDDQLAAGADVDLVRRLPRDQQDWGGVGERHVWRTDRRRGLAIFLRLGHARPCERGVGRGVIDDMPVILVAVAGRKGYTSFSSHPMALLSARKGDEV